MWGGDETINTNKVFSYTLTPMILTSLMNKAKCKVFILE